MYLQKSLVKRQKINWGIVLVLIQNTKLKIIFSIFLRNASRLLIVVQTWDEDRS